MTAALSPGSFGQGGVLMSVANTPLSQTFAVRLIDRRTGKSHRVNGSPLVLFTRTPDVAVVELLAGRDPAVWEARIEPVETGNRTDSART